MVCWIGNIAKNGNEPVYLLRKSICRMGDDSMHKINEVRLIDFSEKGDARGRLVIIEGGKDIPFDIKRAFYIYGTDWDNYEGTGQPERTYKIAIAQSANLTEWKRNGIQIVSEKFKGEAQALPTVIKKDGIWHLFFCYRHTVGFRENSSMAYRIGYAYSKDLKTWIRNDGGIQVPLADWCDEMQCYPNVFLMNGEIYLLYNGNRFGKNGFGLLRLEDEK